MCGFCMCVILILLFLQNAIFKVGTNMQLFETRTLSHSPRFADPLTARVVGDTTDDFTTSFLHLSLFSIALWDLANSRPVHSLMLPSHLFLCLPCPLDLYGQEDAPALHESPSYG